MIWDWSIALGVLGIAFTWFTYHLANKKMQWRRYHDAKDMIVSELSTSLGEDRVPSRTIVHSVIRSIAKELGGGAIVSNIKIDEIYDDLVRRITADPFLSAKRRESLQADIESVRWKREEQPDTTQESSEFTMTVDESTQLNMRALLLATVSTTVLLSVVALLLPDQIYASIKTKVPGVSLEEYMASMVVLATVGVIILVGFYLELYARTRRKKE